MVKKSSRLVAFHDCLERSKHCEKAEAVLLVAQDGQLIRLLLAWDKILVRRKRRLSELPHNASDRRQWEWLWENVSYSIEDLAAVSGSCPDLVEKNMAVLRGNRLVYPDGSMNRYVEQYLKAKVLNLFKVKGTRRPRPENTCHDP